MDESVIRAMQRWPNVPAVYGWLRLDRRGDWQLDGERISHRQFREFIDRNYMADERGCWYFQNGPQRVFIALDATPWVIRRRADGELETHTGVAVREVRAVFLDEEGSLVLESEHGPGLLHDNDLDWALDQLMTRSGNPADAEALDQALRRASGEDTPLSWQGQSDVPVQRLDRDAMPDTLHFVREPEEQS
ncbi:MAG: DUF2946 family protein [Ectothiorhodospiraceae bacterium]|nr:DUF2946 family protein [Ectothiorhodospiraceae bacterium]MCH8503107.1 DUF2946 family protein [Ectothiorhodospiraceae bacterium]